MKILELEFSELPVNNLSERRRSVSHGRTTWSENKRIVIPMDFDSSLYTMFFATPFGPSWRNKAVNSLLSNAFEYGSLGSPLYRVIREEKQLAYSAGIASFTSWDNSYFAIVVKAGAKNLEQVEWTLLDLLRNDKQLRSKEWLNTIKRSRRYRLEMRTITPRERVSEAVREVAMLGETITSEEFLDLVDEVTHEDIIYHLNRMVEQEPHVVIGLGK